LTVGLMLYALSPTDRRTKGFSSPIVRATKNHIT
jgi:hypothetical protein